MSIHCPAMASYSPSGLRDGGAGPQRSVAPPHRIFLLEFLM
jgi:hypothetical protein